MNILLSMFVILSSSTATHQFPTQWRLRASSQGCQQRFPQQLRLLPTQSESSIEIQFDFCDNRYANPQTSNWSQAFWQFWFRFALFVVVFHTLCNISRNARILCCKEDEGNLDKWRIIAETFLTFCSLIGVALRMSGRAAERRRLTEEQEDWNSVVEGVSESDRQTEILQGTERHRESSLVPSKYIIVSKLMWRDLANCRVFSCHMTCCQLPASKSLATLRSSLSWASEICVKCHRHTLPVEGAGAAD